MFHIGAYTLSYRGSIFHIWACLNYPSVKEYLQSFISRACTLSYRAPIFHIGAFLNSPSNWWWFVSLCLTFDIVFLTFDTLWLTFDINDNLIQHNLLGIFKISWALFSTFKNLSMALWKPLELGILKWIVFFFTLPFLNDILTQISIPRKWVITSSSMSFILMN